MSKPWIVSGRSRRALRSHTGKHMLGKTLSLGAVYGVANILSAGVPFLLLPILTRALSPAQYGDVIAFYILVSVCNSMAGLSLQGAVGVYWLNPSRSDPRGFTGSAILLVVFSTCFAAGGSAVVAPKFGIHLQPAVCALAAVVAGANVLQSIRFAIWQCHERPLPAGMLQVGSAALNLLLSLVAVLSLNLGGVGRILGATLSGLLIAGFSIITLVWDGSLAKPSWPNSKELLRFGVPLIPHVLAGALLTNADTLAVSAKLGSKALGVYGAACQLGMILNVVADAAIKAYTPTLYRLLGRGTMFSKLTIVGITYISIPIWLLGASVIWMGLKVAGPLILGHHYFDAIDLSIWFLLGGAMTGVYLNIAGIFFFSGRTEWISVATLTASAFTVLLSPFAISTYGVRGGGSTYFAAQVLLLIAAWLLSLRVKRMPWMHPTLAVRVLARRFGEVK